MNFGQAIEALKQGKKVIRNTVWNEFDVPNIQMRVAMIWPDENSPFTHPFLVIERWELGENETLEYRIPWCPLNTDIYADDWEVLE